MSKTQKNDLKIPVSSFLSTLRKDEYNSVTIKVLKLFNTQFKTLSEWHEKAISIETKRV